MKLYITNFSPYARMARIMVWEKQLGSRIEEELAQTRKVDSPYYRINPSGRVPYLVRDDGGCLEDSQVICDYLDQLDGAPHFLRPAGEEHWETLRLEVLGRSMMDGVSVWIRELARPPEDRSRAIIAHEQARSERLITAWEPEIDAPLMNGSFNYPQMVLATALQLELYLPEFEWRPFGPKLAAWLDRIADRPSLQETVPPIRPRTE